jgi:biopolymer transport protein ExbB/TolQ
MKRHLSLAGMIAGAILMTSPILGLAGTVFGMTRAFNQLGSTGVGDPAVVSDSIGTTLFSTFLGMALLPVGLVLFSISLILFLRYRTSNPPSLPLTPSH